MARPFLKWAGGKGKLAPRIVAAAPEHFGRYHEPFMGAGAVFFALSETFTLTGRATLSDANAALIETFSGVRDHPGALIGRLAALQTDYLALEPNARADFYYRQRADMPVEPIQRAARFIFLNKTCYNGLYRVNAGGGFNVPHGRYTSPRILDAELIHACAKALSSIELCHQDFDDACGAAQPGDFVYLDPPYQPLSATARFTSYTSADFGQPEQTRLRDAFDALTRRGVYALLSNSEHPAIRALYEGRGYDLELVAMSRAINSRASARAPIPELLISNFRAVRPATV
ncbi:MAG: DNA adenine methylase [Tepidiformaceae bacterium]